MVQKTLNGGLILRSFSEGKTSDKANLPKFFYDVFTDEYGEEDAYVEPFTRDLISGQHPTVTDDDVWVVVDPTKNDQIVSSVMLIPQIWRYDGIDLKVGRVELVATLKEYRHRGLVRELMKIAHERSAMLGHHMQSITGIPFYYRQFGYGMAVSLGSRAFMPLDAIQKSDEDRETEPEYVLRIATPEDIPAISAFADYYGKQCLMYTVRSEAEWQHEFRGKQPDNDEYITFLMIQNKQRQDVGFVGYVKRPSGRFNIVALAVGEQTSYLACLQDALRGLKAHLVEEYADSETDTPRFLGFDGGLHPTIFNMLSKNIHNNVSGTSYAWYLRVPDWAHFFKTIAPILDRRLEGSGAHRYTGEFTINFFNKTALKLEFDNGQLSNADNLTNFTSRSQAAFPFDSFLDLVFGFRTLDEITQYYPDANAHGDVSIVLDILFRKRHTWLLAID